MIDQYNSDFSSDISEEKVVEGYMGRKYTKMPPLFDEQDL
jgi:hypothetical protein